MQNNRKQTSEQELKPLDQIRFGRHLRTVREDLNMTREVLAEMVGVSPIFISDMEYGNKSPSIRTLYLLSQALGVTADYLLSGNLYDMDKDEEAKKTREEIISTLKTCSPKHLESFKAISVIYADVMKELL